MKSYPQISTVRIEIEPDKVSQGSQWLREAHDNGYNVIATYHKYTVLGSDNCADLMDAAVWWAQNYDYLRQSGDFTINLMNEWGSHDQNATSFASSYNTAMQTLRAVYGGLVIIDIPGWGQETHTAAEASPLIADPLIALSAHVYPQSWNGGLNRALIPSDMDELHSTGRPCYIGEFGTIGDGAADVQEIVSRAKDLGFPVLGWSWNGDGGEMNMVSPPWSTDPTASVYFESSYFTDVISLL